MQLFIFAKDFAAIFAADFAAVFAAATDSILLQPHSFFAADFAPEKLNFAAHFALENYKF